MVSADLDTRVADEQASIATDGSTETVVMALNLRSDVDSVALVVPTPTPTPATVSAASSGTFDELQQLTAPRVDTVGDWSLGGAPGSDGRAGAAAPQVIHQVQLGPLEATTMKGGDLTGVRDWLQAAGYVLRPEISAGLEP